MDSNLQSITAESLEKPVHPYPGRLKILPKRRWFIILTLLVSGIVPAGLLCSIETLEIILAFLLLFIAGLLITLHLGGNLTAPSRRCIRDIFIVAFSLRMGFILLLLFLNQAFDRPLFAAEYNSLFADDLSYHQKSITIANTIGQNGYQQGYRLAAFYFPVNIGYCYASGVLYHWFPDLNTFLIRIINCLLDSLSAVLIFQIASLVYSDIKVARWSGMLTAVFPVSIVLASVQYKDTVVIFLFLVSVLSLLNLFKRLTWNHAGRLLVSLGLLVTVRIALIAIICIAGVLYIVSRYGLKKAFFITAIFVTGLFLLIRYVYPIEGLLHVYSFSFLSEIGQRVSRQYMVTAAAENSLAFMIQQQGGLWALYLFHAALFIVGPLPDGKLGIFAAILPGVWLWYLLLPAAAAGIYYSARNKIRYSGFLILLCGMIFCMTVVSLNGSNFRYRQQVMPLFLILAAAGLLYLKHVRLVYLCYLSAGALIGCVYLLIKYS